MNDLRVEGSPVLTSGFIIKDLYVGVVDDKPTLVTIIADEHFISIRPYVAREIAEQLVKSADHAEGIRKRLS